MSAVNASLAKVRLTATKSLRTFRLVLLYASIAGSALWSQASSCAELQLNNRGTYRAFYPLSLSCGAIFKQIGFRMTRGLLRTNTADSVSIAYGDLYNTKTLPRDSTKEIPDVNKRRDLAEKWKNDSISEIESLYYFLATRASLDRLEPIYIAFDGPILRFGGETFFVGRHSIPELREAYEDVSEDHPDFFWLRAAREVQNAHKKFGKMAMLTILSRHLQDPRLLEYLEKNDGWMRHFFATYMNVTVEIPK